MRSSDVFRVVCLALMLVNTVSPLHAAVFRWVDKEGVTHFSDTPPSDPKINAVEVNNLDLSPSSETTPGNPSGNTEPSPSMPIAGGTTGSSTQTVTYESLVFLSPTDKETYNDPEGKISIALKVTPSLGEKDAIQVFLDGNALGKPEKATQYNLTNLERGQHELYAAVVNDQGAVLLKSNSITFSLFRPSALFGKNKKEQKAPGGN